MPATKALNIEAALADLDWTAPAIDLLDAVTERLADQWEAHYGRPITDQAFMNCSDTADLLVASRLA